MAFIFQSLRWQDKQSNHQIGPGSYQINYQQRQKLGIISPQNKTKLLMQNVKNQKLTSQQLQKQIRSQIFEHEIILRKNQTAKKLNKRVKSGKLHSYNSYRKQNIQRKQNQIENKTDQNKQKKISLKVFGNYEQGKQQDFKNKLIRQSIQNNGNNSFSTQKNNMFSDSNLRLFKPIYRQNYQKNKNNQQQNIQMLKDFMNSIKAPPNKKLMKFVKQSYKGQNFFIAKPINQNFIQQKQNFIIASDDCKVQRISHKRNDNNLTGNERNSTQFQSCGDIHTTGLEDDSSESEFEYLTNDTPGPGYYQIRKDNFVKKSQVQKFGITEKRFKQKINNDKILDLNIEIPRKKVLSRASQAKVAFGKSRPITPKIQTKQNLRFYQDFESFQRKFTTTKRPVSSAAFSSKCDRFGSHKRLFYTGPDFFDNNKQVPVTIPNSIFMSKVERINRPHSPTAQVDFQGQNLHTIEKKIQKFKQNLEFLQDQYPGFSSRAPRFNYNQEQINEHNPYYIYRNEKKQLKPKGFTFSKDQKNYLSSKSFNSPPPGSYSTQMKWIKPSHHIKFKI